MSVVLESTLTCPECGTRKAETMPTNACLYFYECAGCRTVLRPKPGDCCVFCSYGTMPYVEIDAAAGAAVRKPAVDHDGLIMRCAQLSPDGAAFAYRIARR